MKTNIQLTLLAFAFVFFAACQGESENSESDAESTEKESAESEQKEANAAITTEYVLQTENSIVNWEATKKFVESGHKGTLKFSNGKIAVSEGKLTDAIFTIDMNTLDNTDLKGTDGYEKLLGHLKSDDFFSVDKFPEASFVLSSAEENSNADYTHTITGDLTIKGITNEVAFPANVDFNESEFNAKGELSFDRTKFDIKYGSDDFFDVVKDKVISNEINLTITVKGQAI